MLTCPADPCASPSLLRATDTISNSVRVVKVYKQASATNITYPEAVRAILAADGIKVRESAGETGEGARDTRDP